MSDRRSSHVTHISEPCRRYEWVMSHISMNHVTYLNESYHIHEWVSPIWMSHVTYMNESCDVYEWVIDIRVLWRVAVCCSVLQCVAVCCSVLQCVAVINMNESLIYESCDVYEWVISHIWMSHVTYMNESCHLYEWVMSHIWTSLATNNSMNHWCTPIDFLQHTAVHCNTVQHNGSGVGDFEAREKGNGHI